LKAWCENVLKFYNFPVLKKIELLCSGLHNVIIIIIRITLALL